MDKIFIQQLKIQAKIGVLPWEMKVLQVLTVDVALYTDLSKAGASDNLDDTISYVDLARQIETLATARHYGLVEHLAMTLVQSCLDHDNVEKVTVSIHKPAAIANAQSTGVTITRTRALVE